MEVTMNGFLRAIDRYLNALARTPGEEFAHGLDDYRLIEHPREAKPRPGPELLGEQDHLLRLAS